eukprot:gene21957-28037_t
MTTLPVIVQNPQIVRDESVFVTKTTSDNEYSVVQTGAPQPPRPSTAPVKITTGASTATRMPMYNPATFRLPSKEVALGFGGEHVELTIPFEDVMPSHPLLHAVNDTASTARNTSRGEPLDKKTIRLKSATEREKPHHGVPILSAEPHPPQSVGDESMSTHQIDIDHDGFLTDRKEALFQESLRADSLTVRSRPTTADINTSKQSGNGKGILNRNKSAAASRNQTVDGIKNISIDFHQQQPSRSRLHSASSDHGTSTLNDDSGHVQKKIPYQTGNTLRCKECYQTAVLWCQECDHAYCGNCWPKIAHHASAEMFSRLRQPHSMVHNFKKPPRLPLPEASQHVRSFVRSTSPVQPGHSTRIPGSPNSYSSAVLMGVYVPDGQNRPDLHNTAVISPVRVPRPDALVTEYRDYPMPPVYLDGKGHVLETVDGPEVDFDTTGRDFLNRPQSPGLRCRSPLNRAPSDHSNKYNNGVPITSNSSYARSSARPRHKNDLGEGSLASVDDPTKFQMNTIHYVSKNKIHTLNPLFAAAASQSDNLNFERTNSKALTVHNDDLDFGRVRVPPSFSAGQGSTLGFAYSSRPSTEARPLTGITMDFMPSEWQEFGEGKYDSDNAKGGISGANTGRRAPTPSDRMTLSGRGQSATARPQSSPHATQHVATTTDMNKRVLELYRGVGVYTKNNLEHEARQASLRILEAGIKDVNTTSLSVKINNLFKVLPTETRKVTPSNISNKKPVPNLSVGSKIMADSGSLKQTSLVGSKSTTKLPLSPQNQRKVYETSKDAWNGRIRHIAR